MIPILLLYLSLWLILDVLALCVLAVAYVWYPRRVAMVPVLPVMKLRGPYSKQGTWRNW